jgi:hypothetical protein
MRTGCRPPRAAFGGPSNSVFGRRMIAAIVFSRS